MRHPIQFVSAHALVPLAMALSLSCPAQNLSVSPSVLTNKDVMVLAGAGFSESFIMDTIAGSRVQFDTTANGLADLAKHAISERIIRAMMEQATQASQPGQMAPGTVTVAAEAPIPVVMPSPEATPPKTRPKMVKPTTVSMAISAGTPFYEWKSVFWGLWKKRVGVAPTAAPQQVVTPHQGNLYPQARPAPQQQYVRVSAPPTYPYEPMAYYLVAPR
jgi:hypothetical protein